MLACFISLHPSIHTYKHACITTDKIQKQKRKFLSLIIIPHPSLPFRNRPVSEPRQPQYSPIVPQYNIPPNSRISQVTQTWLEPKGRRPESPLAALQGGHREHLMLLLNIHSRPKCPLAILFRVRMTDGFVARLEEGTNVLEEGVVLLLLFCK